MDIAKSKGVNLNSFYTISVVGKGSYAKVILVKKKDTGKYYAMKVLKKQRISKKKQEDHVRTERDILVQMTDHPFLTKLYWSFQTDKKLYFILEYCPGGELFGLLQKKRRFTEDQARFFAAQMVLSIEHLHKNNVIYRDLKPENVLINYDGYIKIADFGLSRMNVNLTEATTICGTPEYLAPEIINKQGYGKPIDWWTLGSIVYEMLVGIPPFYTNNRQELFHKIKYENPTYPKYFSSETLNFLEALLMKIPGKRLGTENGAEDIKKHSWFENVNWDYIYKKRYEPFFIPKCKGDLGLNNFDAEFTETTIQSLEVNDHGPYKKFEGFSWNPEEIKKNDNNNKDMDIEEE